MFSPFPCATPVLPMSLSNFSKFSCERPVYLGSFFRIRAPLLLIVFVKFLKLTLIMPLSSTHSLIGYVSALRRLSNSIMVSMRIIANAIGIIMSILQFLCRILPNIFFRVYSYFCLPWSTTKYSLRSSFQRKDDTKLRQAL